MIAGQSQRDGDLARRIDEVEAHVVELSIQQNRGSQTTHTAQKLGAVRLLVPVAKKISNAYLMK